MIAKLIVVTQLFSAEMLTIKHWETVLNHQRRKESLAE